MKADRFTDYDLHSFVDGELDSARKQTLLTAMERDSALAARVCDLQRAKHWMRSAFETAEPPEEHPNTYLNRRRWIRPGGIAASVLLLILAFTAGWLARPLDDAQIDNVVLENLEKSSYRVVLHIDHADPRKFKQVLKESEKLLKDYADKGVQVEILANSTGLDLLRVDVSPYANEIARILSKYDNIRLVACSNAVKRLREQGVKPVLFEGTLTDESAIEHAVKRLREGWSYIKV